MTEFNSKIKKPPALFVVGGILIASCILVVDSLIPLGVADGMLYIVLVLLGLLAGDRRYIIGGAVVGTVLTLVGFYVSPPGGELWKVVVNRGLAIFAIWITAFLCLLHNRSREKIESTHAELDARVKDRTAQLKEANENLRRESSFVQLHKDIAVASNETRAVEETMAYCLSRVCAHAGWPVGHLYLSTDPSSSRLVPTPIWHLDDPRRFATFRKITEATPFDPGVGLPGRVLSSGKPAWIIDVTQDPNFPRAKLAENIGVKAGFAFPILVGTEVVGVMEFFSAQAAEPDDKMLEIMAQVGTQLGRVLERERAAKEIQYSREQLRNLYRRLELVREEERTRIAREVHDGLGQVLTTLKLELSLLDRKIPSDNRKLHQNMELIFELVDNTLQTVKKIAMDLRPPILDQLGLSEAIEWQGKEFEKLTGIQCKLDLGTNNIQLDRERSTTVFRIFQEALTNVARHAKATKINVKLEENSDIFTLQVKDNGRGITPTQVSNLQSLGLLGMRERALVWGGKVEIQGVPNQGTTVTIQIERK